MIIDQGVYDIFRDKYHAIDIESVYESANAYGVTVDMRLTYDGFVQLIKDLFNPEKIVLDARDVFTITPMEIKEDKKIVYVAKYAMDKYPLDLISEYGKKLHEFFDAEGRSFILMPKIIDVSVLTVEQLKQMRDSLTELIQNLSYDNIIGFGF